MTATNGNYNTRVGYNVYCAIMNYSTLQTEIQWIASIDGYQWHLDGTQIKLDLFWIGGD